MNDEELYGFSAKLGEFVRISKNLDVYHWYRYRYFVDNSKFTDPSQCKYVVRTRRFGEEQKKLLSAELKECRDLLDSLIGDLDA